MYNYATGSMPKISADANLVGTPKRNNEKYATTAMQVKNFFKSEDFQDYCNHKKNQISEGLLIWIVKVENGFSELLGTKGIFYLDFEILTKNTGFEYVKYPKLINKIGVGMKKILFSQSYIIRKKSDGKWKADLILADEAWLKASLVSEAFAEVALYRSLKVVGKPTMMGLTNLADAGASNKKPIPYAWVQVMTNKEGVGRLLVCLVDSGKIFECAPDEYLLSAASYPGMVKNQYNWFKYFSREELVRN